MTAAQNILAAAPWLTQGLLPQLLALLDGDGEEARVIGGAVRNTLFGQPPGDIDVATTALPEEVTRRAGRAGFKVAPTGIEHGTVTVVAAGQSIEVTTLREDIETFGRKATVRFGRNWQADAARRDFTINALSVGRDGTVFDPVGGLADIAARRVRFIGDPESRIREDFLRILRFFRFHAAYGEGAPDPAGLQASIRLRAGLELLSRERVRMELMKLLVAPGAGLTAKVMADAGLLAPILGVPLVPQFSCITQLEQLLGLPPEAVRRLGALAVHVTDDAERLAQKLRLSKMESERLASMAEGWWRIGENLTEKAARAMLYRLGSERFLDRVLVAWSREGRGADAAGWRAYATVTARWMPPGFPLRAAEFIQRGVPVGPALGKALAGAEADWIAADFPSDADTLNALAQKWADWVRG